VTNVSLVLLTLEPLHTVVTDTTVELPTVDWVSTAEVPVLLLLTSTLCVGVGVDVTDATRATRRIVLLLLDVADTIVEQSTVAWGWTVPVPIPVLLISKPFSGRLVVAVVARATRRMDPLVLEPLLSMAVETMEEGATAVWWRAEVPVLLLLMLTLFVGRPVGADVAEATKATKRMERRRYIQRV
jgi:hypothetical protein